MLGLHITNDCIATSQGKVKTEAPWLDWLINKIQIGKSKGVDTYNTAIAYHLDTATASLLRLIEATEAECKKLLDTKKLRLSPYRLEYYPGKLLMIDRGYGKGHPYAIIYHAGQYTDTHFSPDDDPVEKAKQAEATGNKVIEAFRTLGLNTNKLTSPVAAMKSRLNELDLPSIDDIPTEAGQFAYECVKGNWLEAFSCGYWNNAYDYDINGAYGSELVKLPDLRNGKWLQSNYYPLDAQYGFAQGQLTVYTPFHPFLLEGKNINYTPIGTWHTTLTLQEAMFLAKYGLGKFEIENGWWWIPKGKQVYPFKELVEWLFNQRSNGGLVKNIGRRCIAGIWGKSIEFRNKDFGPLFNPIYGAVVETNNRLKVAGACLDNRVVPLHMAVDGVIANKPLRLEFGTGMGQWRLSHQGRCIIVSSGVVGFEGKQGAEEFSLRFGWLDEQMRAKPGVTQLKMEKWAPVTLAKALHSGKFDKLGELEKLVRTIYLVPDYKRLWQRKPSNAGEILSGQYSSEPLEASMIKGVEYGDRVS